MTEPVLHHDINPAQAIDNVASELGLTMTADFVPFSQSRNKAEKHPSLNWIVTLQRNGKPFLTTDYSTGCAHCPSYKPGSEWGTKRDFDREIRIKTECETGYPHLAMMMGVADRIARRTSREAIKPALRDVLYSLSMDSDVLERGSFEEWAADFGYDTDSRKAETIYRACLNIALKMRNAIGEDGLVRLREACQDY